MSQPKYRQIINCVLTILIVALFFLCRLRITTQLRSGTVDKSKWPVFLQNASGNPIHGPTSVVFSQLGEVVRHSGLYKFQFHSCPLCLELSHQGRNKGASMPRAPNHWGAPKSRNNVVNFFFNAIHLLLKYLRFKYGGAELVSCPGRNLTSVHPFVASWTLRKNPIFGACT